MSLAELTAAVLTVLLWGYLLLARGGFWRIRGVASQPAPAKVSGCVAVIVPARNEADVIGQSLASLLCQVCDESLRIFIVDDASTDSTGQVALQTALRMKAEDRVTIISSKPLPAGWTGKLWALEQGIEKAKELNPGFFLLTDADVLHSPESVSSLVAIAESSNFNLASYMVMLHCQTFAEKLLVPAFVFFFFKLYPPQWVSDSRHLTAGAAGGCMLVRPAALGRAGGIQAIRGEIIDDCALARIIKRSGGRLWLGTTRLAASLRGYGSFAELGNMISRTAFNQLRHSVVLLAAALVGMVATYLLPLALLFSPHLFTAGLGAVACVAMITAYLPTIMLYRLNPAWALLLPLAAIFYMAATIHSALRFWSGVGGVWKGRVQDVAS
jgi:hopene-associated glycosyltransferase HpnB